MIFQNSPVPGTVKALSPDGNESSCSSPWCLLGTGGMDYGGYSWGLYRDYYRDPFPHSLLSTREFCTAGASAVGIRL